MKKVLLLAPLVLAACGSGNNVVSAPLTIDRPVDISFACYGAMIQTSDGTEVKSAQPATSCDARAQVPTVVPPGQEAAKGTQSWFGFVLQSASGTVAMVNFPVQPSEKVSPITDLNLVDGDPLTPGHNAIAVGDLPVAIATDRAGCQVITANAGTCDLSILDVGSFVDGDSTTPPLVTEQAITNATGQAVLAKPAAMIAEPAENTQPIGNACPATPEGLVYVAYPACHLVAAVRAGTGQIEAGIRFNADGTVDLTDGNVSCPAECGDAGAAPTDGPRPVTLDLEHDPRSGTRRMVIGTDNTPNLTIVELGADYKPLSEQPVALEGDIGVTDVAISPQIGMGGSADELDDSGTAGGQHQFVYAVATDSTVRVADITGTYTECDTQADPRFLRGVTDIGFLSCMPVGDPRTPPRRPGALGPGIQTITGSAPLSVAIATVNPLDVCSAEDPNCADLGHALARPQGPSNLVGYFAFVTTTLGDTLIVNIDDDDYKDFWSSTDPLDTELPLAIAHQIRDGITSRTDIAEHDSSTSAPGTPDCTKNDPEGQGGPHLDPAGISLLINPSFLDSSKQYTLPSIHQLECTDGITGTSTAISELGFQAPLDQRELAFPDWRNVKSQENWNLAWEGPLSRDDATHAIDGPSNRDGIVAPDGNEVTITDPSHPFCEMGTQEHDFAILTGCDPAQGDSQCGVGETCFVHPDATVATGACLPTDQANSLATTCRDYLITYRRYGILRAESGEIHMVPRRRVLETTPVDGCTSDTQCQDLAAYKQYLDSPDEPKDFMATTPPAHSYTCEKDPTRPGTINRCVETCTMDSDCDDGTVCSNGTCIEGVVPPAACVQGVERYQVHASDAFTVIGSASGYVHPVIEDPSTGSCIIDPNANPLDIGRIPLTAPACPSPEDFTTVAPNPCETTVQQTEHEPDYTNDQCDIGNASGKLVTRDADAIRFRNRAMTLNLVDPAYPGDKSCRGDRGGWQGTPLVGVPAAHAGMQLIVPITSGFSSARLPAGPFAPSTPVFPAKVKLGPQQSIWVMDEGDFIPEQAGDVSTRGQVFKYETTTLISNQVQ